MISYVLDSCHLAGGHKVVFEHVAGLSDRGHNVQVMFRRGDYGWFGRSVPHTKYRLPTDLTGIEGDLVATWCGTAPWVARCGGGYYLVQDLDEETYMGRRPQTYGLGLRTIVEGKWVEDQLRSRFTQEPVNVGIGTHYRYTARQRDRFRIFTQCRMAPGDLKGWQTTLATVRRAHTREPRVSVVTFGMRRKPRVPHVPHIHLQRPSDEKLEELHAQAGVFLFTSRHEGFGLPALEAMACACPVVTTPADGNLEFCINGETALVRTSPESLAESCVELMHNDELWTRLSEQGFDKAQEYRWPAVFDRLERVYGL